MNSANLKMNTVSVEEIDALNCIRFCDEWLADHEKKQLPAILKWNALLKGGSFGVIPREDPKLDAPRPSDEEIKKLLNEPLTASTDALRLKELEGRFPGATIRLSSPAGQGVVKYLYEDFYEDDSVNHLISFDLASYPCHTFESYGVKGQPTLVAEWHGIQIDLSHLF